MVNPGGGERLRGNDFLGYRSSHSNRGSQRLARRKVGTWAGLDWAGARAALDWLHASRGNDFLGYRSSPGTASSSSFVAMAEVVER
jgi:hypothetical protein